MLSSPSAIRRSTRLTLRSYSAGVGTERTAQSGARLRGACGTTTFNGAARTTSSGITRCAGRLPPNGTAPTTIGLRRPNSVALYRKSDTRRGSSSRAQCVLGTVAATPRASSTLCGAEKKNDEPAS